jgi:hypothetical protein
LLAEIAEEFKGQIGRQPSLTELLEILTWGLKSLADEPFSDVKPGDVLALRLEGDKALERSGVRSSVSDLNDSVFVAASDLVMQVTAALQRQSGSKPSLKEFCRILENALSADPASRTKSGKGPKIAAKLRKGKTITVRVGDMVAIPARNGQYFITVVVAKNTFGVAYGLFKGTHAARPLSSRAHPPVDSHPIYDGEEFIQGGQWKIIGHDATLLSLFPAEPEIYHYQRSDVPRPTIGPYGSGETASGRLRAISKEEAQELGLLSGKYRSVLTPQQLEERLNQELSRS